MSKSTIEWFNCLSCGKYSKKNKYKNSENSKYYLICRSCSSKERAKNHISRKFDPSTVIVDQNNFTATDKNGLIATLNDATRSVFDYQCVNCQKIYKCNLCLEYKKKYKWHCKSCAISREWNENDVYRSVHETSLKEAAAKPEFKERSSIVSRKNWNNPEIRKAMMDNRDRKAAGVKGSQTRMENLLSGKTVFHISHGMVCRYNGPNGQYAMRSTYEFRFAKYLDSQFLKWKYENCTYSVCGGTKTYTPDFEIDDYGIVEVKGWWRDDAYEKYASFVSSSSKPIVLIMKDELEGLENGTITIENLFDQTSWFKTSS